MIEVSKRRLILLYLRLFSKSRRFVKKARIRILKDVKISERRNFLEWVFSLISQTSQMLQLGRFADWQYITRNKQKRFGHDVECCRLPSHFGDSASFMSRNSTGSRPFWEETNPGPKLETPRACNSYEMYVHTQKLHTQTIFKHYFQKPVKSRLYLITHGR